jgi:uncharacterized protein involved in cysteine biosynthesis
MPPHGDPIRPGTGFFLTDVVHGFVMFFRAVLVLFNRVEFTGLLFWAVAANVVVCLLVFVGFWFGLHDLFLSLAEEDWGWASFLRGPVQWSSGWLAFVLSVLSLWFLAPAVIGLVCEPFLDPIAARTERLVGGPGLGEAAVGFWRSLGLGLASTVRILAAQVVLLAPLLLLSFCGIGVVLGALLGALFAGLVWLGIPAMRRGLGFDQRVTLLRRNWARLVGFGLAFEAGMFVPLFNLFLLTPTAAVAISVLYFHLDKRASPRGAG